MEEARKAINQRMIVLVHGVFQVRCAPYVSIYYVYKLSIYYVYKFQVRCARVCVCVVLCILLPFQLFPPSTVRRSKIKQKQALSSDSLFFSAHFLSLIHRTSSTGPPGCRPTAVPALQATHSRPHRVHRIRHELLHAAPCLPKVCQIQGAVV